MTKYKIVAWFEPAIPSRAKIKPIYKFDARGMRKAYGVGNNTGNQTFYLDIWKHPDGRMYARFWSRSKVVYWESYEIVGLKDNFTSDIGDDRGVQLILRKEYDSWVKANLTSTYPKTSRHLLWCLED
jgi:hypothetical protein